jgi:hypothetical protein
MKDAGNGNGNAAAGAAGSGSGSGGANHLLVGRWCGTFIEWQDTVCTTPRHRYDGDGADDDDDDAPCQGGRGARHAALFQFEKMNSNKSHTLQPRPPFPGFPTEHLVK